MAQEDDLTVKVLEDGHLPPMPSALTPGQKVPVAFWRGEQYGAVLLLWPWKDGVTVDSDCCISERSENGSWDTPQTCGGGGWLADGLTRSTTGWHGDHVVWMGSSSLGPASDENDFDDGPGVDGEQSFGGVTITIPAGLSPEEEAAYLETHAPRWEPTPNYETIYRVAEGVASTRVVELAVEHAGRTWTAPIDSPAGTFLVGIEGAGPATVRALDAAGDVVPYADGTLERTV